jgi:hypothetical protein
VTNAPQDPGPVITRIVSVLAVSLVISIAGLIVLGLAGGDAGVRATLTHVIETLIGVFIGVAAARLAPD